MIKCDDAICARKGGLFKYVRMADNSIRFISFDRPWIPNHSDVVDHGERAFSAGTVEILHKTKEVRMERPDSMTLGIKSAPDDLAVIKEFLWKKSAKKTTTAIDKTLAAERTRIFKLALSSVSVRAIAERLGFTYDRVRRLIERAEARKELPAGTLAKCGVSPKPSKLKVERPPQAFRIYAPQRAAAAAIGACSACQQPTEIVIEIQHLDNAQIKLCPNHAKDLSAAIEAALREASASRSRFNGKL